MKNQEVENFLWDMEAYFHATRIPVEEQATMCAAYLGGEAMLWWPMQVASPIDSTAILTWTKLKEKLQRQFIPGKADWVVMESLLQL